MFKRMSELHKAGMYTALVLIISSIMGLGFHAKGPVYMFSPVITVMIMLLITGDGFTKAGWKELGIHKAGFRKWGFSLFMPLIVLTTGYALFLLTPDTYIKTPEDLHEANPWAVALKLFILVISYTLTSVLGEEIGWRGYLLPKLQGLGTHKALWLSGFIHAIFHFPIFFAGNYLSEGNPFIVVSLFVIMTMFSGVFFGYVRLSTGSVWPAVIMHSVHNCYFNIVLKEFVHSKSTLAPYLGGETGIFIVILYGVVTFWLLKKGNFTANTNLSQQV